MLKYLSLVLIIALVNAESHMEQTMLPEETTMMMESTTELPIMSESTTEEMNVNDDELPCLNRAIGATIPHPGDIHKFLRCVSFDTLWVEACPSNLVYNQWLGLCDWNNDKPTTAAPTTPGPETTPRPFNDNEPRLIKGFDWLKQLNRIKMIKMNNIKKGEDMDMDMDMETTTTPEIIETESTTPEMIKDGKVALSKDTMNKFKDMIKKTETTPEMMMETTPEMMMMTTEKTPIETATAFIEKDGLWINPEMMAKENTNKVHVPKDTMEKMQRMFHKTV